MINSARTPSLKSVPFFVEEFHMRGNQRRCTVFSFTVSRAMISSARTPSLKSVLFFVEEFHMRETSAAAPFSFTVNRAMISSARTQSQSVPLFVEEFHMRKPAPLHFSRSRSIER
ncbi:hypothetical protein EVAR_98784_1 [Eumeta japonica]|uniref:Uncharacterized protein n=1 Tax=Eumeta variegata TaxID=151549 RepID=A0A4C1YVN9_EUMVA|nr:hypothetical protein EVAR_98784_1 [Eumeta japonica]